MKKNNLPNPTLHEIRAANPTATRMAIPKNAQSYAKTIERMAGVGYNRKREVNTLLEMQTKGNRIGGRVHPDTNTNRFGNLPINRMAVRQNKYLNPDIEQVQETLRTGNANRRNIAKSRYVNGIAGKGFEGENLVIPKRGRPYKGQPNSLPLISKVHKKNNNRIQKNEYGFGPPPPPKNTQNNISPYYDIYREMYNPNIPGAKKKINPQLASEKEQAKHPLTFLSNLGAIIGTQALVVPKLENYGKQLLRQKGLIKPIVEGVKTNKPLLGKVANWIVPSFGVTEAAISAPTLADIFRSNLNEIQYNTILNQPKGINQYAENIVNPETIRQGKETQLPLFMRRSLDENNFENNYKDFNDAYTAYLNSPLYYGGKTYANIAANLYELMSSPMIPVGSSGYGNPVASLLRSSPEFLGAVGIGFIPALNGLINGIQELSLRGMSGIPKKGRVRGSATDNSLLTDILYGNTNPVHESTFANTNPVHFKDLPMRQQQEVGRFAFPTQQRLKPTYDLAIQELIDGLFTGNAYQQNPLPDNSTLGKLRQSFGSKGINSAMADHIVSQVKGWNKSGDMQDLLTTTAYNNGTYGAYPLYQDKTYVKPAYITDDKSYRTKYKNMLNPDQSRYFNYNYDDSDKIQLSNAFNNILDKNEFMVGAQISGNPQYANVIQDKTFWDRLGDKLPKSIKDNPEMLQIGKSMNAKYGKKDEYFEKSMTKTQNKYFVKKGK
jgi:hypothetical protein